MHRTDGPTSLHSLNDDLTDAVLAATGAQAITRVDTLQRLWSGYGDLLRLHVNGACCRSVILKRVSAPEEPAHPRGWHGAAGDARKRRSYRVEANWYRRPALASPTRTARALAVNTQPDSTFLLLEDLSTEFPDTARQLCPDSIGPCLQWLAGFHARFLADPGDGCWEIGSYWHLGTRRDEYDAMPDGPLKRAASALDAALADARFQTLVHGDAKVANFLFSADGLRVAAVDFQYLGRGPGIRDVVYLLGSCLDEPTLATYTDALLERYADMLIERISQHHPSIDAAAVADEWLQLHDIAVADFQRFLAGWAPQHEKRNAFAADRVYAALNDVDQQR